MTPNLPYVDYDFATKTSGAPFDCKGGPTNDSPYNTGLKTLPPVAQPDVWYSYLASPHFPELEPEGPEGNGGIAPMGGPAYVYEKRNKSVFKFPKYYDGKPLFYEWTRDYIKEMRLTKSRTLDGIFPFNLTAWVDNPMDMEFGPDGALYVLEYGDGYFAENPDAALSKINFVRGNHTPLVKVAATPGGGQAPLTVAFSSAGTGDLDGDKLSFDWDFDGDGKVDSHQPNPSHTFTKNGSYKPDAAGDRQDRAVGLGLCAGAGRQSAAGDRPHDHVAEGGRSVPLRRCRHLHGHGHRRSASGLQQGHRVLRARP